MPVFGAIALLAAATATSTSTPAVGQARFETRLAAYALAGGALNPDALALFAGIERRHTKRTPDSVLLGEQYVQYGADVMLSGLFKIGGHAELLPLRIFKLRLQYELWLWPGFALGRGHGLVFSSRDAPFGPDELERRRGEEISGAGHRLALAPTVQLKLWRIVTLDTFEVAGWYVHGPEAFWREPLHDNMIRRGALDAVAKNTALLLLEVYSGGPDERVLIGGIHEVVHSFAAGITRHRLGGALIASPFRSLLGLDRPTLFWLIGSNVRDRNREGELWMQLGVRIDLDVNADVE